VAKPSAASGGWPGVVEAQWGTQWDHSDSFEVSKLHADHLQPSNYCFFRFDIQLDLSATAGPCPFLLRRVQFRWGARRRRRGFGRGAEWRSHCFTHWGTGCKTCCWKPGDSARLWCVPQHEGWTRGDLNLVDDDEHPIWQQSSHRGYNRLQHVTTTYCYHPFATMVIPWSFLYL